MDTTIEIDESRFPVVVTTFRGLSTAEELDHYFERIQMWCRERRRYAMIADLSGAEPVNAAVRKRIAEGMAAIDAGTARYCAGLAMVLTNPLIRGAVTAVLWLQPIKYPHAVVATRAEGRVLCEKWLAKRPSVAPAA